jgi:hypothetical protein
MAKKYNNASDPVTSRDWFLHDLFNDPKFVELRDGFLAQVAKFDPGLSQLMERPLDDREIWLLDTYADKASTLFKINKEVAKKGLYHSQYLTTWSRSRNASARIDGNSVTITIGPETRYEDVKSIWSSKVVLLQDELLSTRSKRLTPSVRPSLAYAIHKHLLRGRMMSEIHRDYSFSKLEGYEGGYGNESYSEFSRHYKNTVNGIKKAL